VEIEGRVVVVTGAAGGIGRALCVEFARQGVAGVVAVDLNRGPLDDVDRAVADLGASSFATVADVTRESDVLRVVNEVARQFGPIDIFCSNAGITGPGGAETLDSDWQRMWDVNVMAHVYAARALLPDMLERGEGYLVNTASAAGLLTNLGAAAYSVTKHAAVAFAEWLSITHGSAGIRVSCLCPQGVNTPMLTGAAPGAGLAEGELAQRAVQLAGRVLEPSDVALAVVAGIREEAFLILPHEEVRQYMTRKAEDPERWLSSMRSAQAALEAPAAP
jgi:NAD(P)-dependent dehydrogenase (short-subunit alcohol dehydrogenase family)